MTRRFGRLPTERRFSPEEEERLRQEYETDWDESWEIAERWGLTKKALYCMAAARGWRRPSKAFQFRSDDQKEQVKSMWEGGISCGEISRVMKVTPDNARNICRKHFGDRNLRMNHHTYMVRRNRAIHRMAYMGARREDLAAAFRLSIHSVNWIVQKLDGSKARNSNKTGKPAESKKHMGKFWRSRKIKPFEEVRRAYLEKYEDEDYEQHETFLREMLLKASAFFKMPAHMILWDTRGTRQQVAVRQVVAYILHCECGLSQMRVAELMGRERSTMSYSMRRVEDKRDDDLVDEEIQKLADDFLDHLRTDLNFVSPYELYFPQERKAA